MEVDHAAGAAVPRNAGEELARGGDAERQVLGEQPLVRRVDVRVGQPEAGDRWSGSPCSVERGHDRQRPARADQQRPGAERALEGVEAELDRRRVGMDEARRRDDQRSTSTSAPSGAASRSSRSTSGGDLLDRLPGASRIDTFASATTGSTVFWSCGEPPSTRSRRAPARRTCGGRTPRPRAGRPAARPASASSSAPGGSSPQPASSSSVGAAIPSRSGSGSRPSRGEHRRRASA